MKQLLLESYKAVTKKHGIDPTKPGKTRAVFADDEAFNYYVESLCEGLKPSDKPGFKIMSEGTRKYVLESSMYALNPYESLALPMLRVFYPKTMAKDLVTYTPINKPEVIRPFIRARFSKYGTSTEYDAPSIDTQISKGPTMGIPVATVIPCPSSTNILTIAGLTSSTAHVEKSFKIVSVNDGTGATTVDIRPTVDGDFTANVTLGPLSDVISGHINYLTGMFDVSSVNGIVTTVGALLAGGVLSTAQNMGLSPAQTNLALQAILNTVIPTVVSRINGKNWSDTIKYTLASAGIGTGIAGASLIENDIPESIDYLEEK